MTTTNPLHDFLINTSIMTIITTDDFKFAVGLAETVNKFLADDGHNFRLDTVGTFFGLKLEAKAFIATFLPGKLGTTPMNSGM